ncbi:DUF317 domain-containing protein [Streptomyces sp. NPDC059255]|uniref:DUF317 domain-containing protein n=1 Tax=Streptomyces sp. NPDC059255 TaxID=3346793 RepID=UPI0036B6752C
MLVTPRYLAGPRDDAFEIFTAALFQHGWTCIDDGYDFRLFTSPCLRVRVGWLPEVPAEKPIQITASTHPLKSPLWHISLDDQAPTEFLTAVITTLARTLAESPHTLFAPDNDQPDDLPLPPTWTGSSGPRVSHGKAPDNLASYSATPYSHPANRPPEEQTRWEFRAGPREHAWQARFSPATPPVLVEAFHRSFTDPAPLTRHRYELDPLLLPHLTLTDPATSSPGDAPTTSQSGQSMNADARRDLIPRSTTLSLIETLDTLRGRFLDATEQWELLDETGHVPAEPSYPGLLQQALDSQALSREVVQLTVGFAHSATSTTRAGTSLLAHLAIAATHSSHAVPYFAGTAQEALSLNSSPTDRKYQENRMVIIHATARRYLRRTSESLGEAVKGLHDHLEFHRFFPPSAGREVPAPPPPGQGAPHR